MSAPLDAGRRRVLLAALGLATSVAIGPRAIGLFLERLAAANDLAQALRELVPHRESAARLGRAYLASVPAEASSTRLVALILGAPTRRTGREAAHVASRIQTEFDAGRVVNVAGWILSPTEARLYALSALG